MHRYVSQLLICVQHFNLFDRLVSSSGSWKSSKRLLSVTVTEHSGQTSGMRKGINFSRPRTARNFSWSFISSQSSIVQYQIFEIQAQRAVSQTSSLSCISVTVCTKSTMCYYPTKIIQFWNLVQFYVVKNAHWSLHVHINSIHVQSVDLLYVVFSTQLYDTKFFFLDIMGIHH